MSYVNIRRDINDKRIYPWLDSFFEDVFKPLGPSKWQVETKETTVTPRWFYTEDRTHATVSLDIPGIPVEGIKVVRTLNQIKVEATGPGREYSFEVPLCRGALPDTLSAEVSNGVLTLRVGMRVEPSPSQLPVEVTVTLK